MLLEDDLTRGLGEMGLSRSRAHLLWVLRQTGPVSQRVLAESLKVTPRAVTALVDALVDEGLVTREADPDDRRAAIVTFTARGKRLATRLKRDHETLAQALFGPMSPTEHDCFEKGLGDVVERLRAHIATPSRRLPSR